MSEIYFIFLFFALTLANKLLKSLALLLRYHMPFYTHPTPKGRWIIFVSIIKV